MHPRGGCAWVRRRAYLRVCMSSGSVGRGSGPLSAGAACERMVRGAGASPGCAHACRCRHPGPCWLGSRLSGWNCGSTCPRGVCESLVYQKGLRMYVSDGRAGLHVRLACRRGSRHPCLGLGVDGQRLCCGTNADGRAELRVRMPACWCELECSRWFALARVRRTCWPLKFG